MVDEGAKPEVVALLPGGDLPRLNYEQKLQIDLSPSGYKKNRPHIAITSISREAYSGVEIAKLIGPDLANSMPELRNGGTFVIVRGRLPSATFDYEHQKMQYTHGMRIGAEVKVQSKAFILTLLPALEKHFPG